MSSTSSTSSATALSGLASGIDWTSIVNELITVESAPETQMTAQQTGFQNKNTAYQGIGSQLTTLAADIKTLSSSSFFDGRTANSSNSVAASATAASGTALGTYNFNIQQLASNAVQMGSTSSGAALSPTDDVSTLVMSSSGYATPITGGTFTVNGQSISIAATDTLQSVFDKINSATSGAVTASYDSTTDTISLNSAGTIVLGSATDTSDFLQASKLYNNNSGTVTSTSGLGGVNLAAPMESANLSTTISDGGSGAGKFLINGVEIDYDASSDSVSDVLQRIDDSNAGVTATYDSINDRFELTNKTSGDVGISLQDETGNFLAATGLTASAGGTLQRGTNLLYKINNGGTLTSQSNTISGASSGISGLSVQALAVGVTNISVNADVSTISSAISSFVTDYNAAQTFISTQITPTTSSTGTVTPGVLTGDLDTESMATKLRQLVNNSPAGLTGVIHSLNDLGISSNGTNNQLSISNSGTLASALNNNLDAVKNLFTNATTGIATTLNTYLTNVNGTNGTLANDESSMTKQITQVSNSITALQQRIANDKTRLTNEFVTMETVINSLNSEKQYLNTYFSSSSASSNTAPSAAGSSSSSSS